MSQRLTRARPVPAGGDDVMMPRWLDSAFVFALACAIGTSASAQTPATTDAGDDLVGTWLVTVAGEARTRTLVISRVTSTADGATLDAAYGLSDQGQGRVPAELRYGDNKQRQLMLTTQAQTKIVASETSGGDFVGTFTLANGVTKSVTISRASAALLVKQPKDDVPAGCARFSGIWSGEWPNYGYTWLWVTEVSKDCRAKYWYGVGARPPTSFSTAAIVDGVLRLSLQNGAIVTFEPGRSAVVATYSGPEGTNRTTMPRVEADAVARVAANQRAATAMIPPGPEVPSECANLFGLWAGRWQGGAAHLGERFVRINRVTYADGRCIAHVAYSAGRNSAPTPQTAEIRSGVLGFVCDQQDGGTCQLWRTGDELAASYIPPFPQNWRGSGLFKRIAD
jgi:hypothetical protein